jgi:hypothetical protein
MSWNDVSISSPFENNETRILPIKMSRVQRYDERDAFASIDSDTESPSSSTSQNDFEETPPIVSFSNLSLRNTMDLIENNMEGMSITNLNSIHKNLLSGTLSGIQEEEEEEEIKTEKHGQLKVIDQDSETTFGRLSELEETRGKPSKSFLSNILQRRKLKLKSDEKETRKELKIPNLPSKIPRPTSSERERKTPLLTKLYNLSKKSIPAPAKPTLSDLQELFEDVEAGELDRDPEAMSAITKFMKQYKVHQSLIQGS